MKLLASEHGEETHQNRCVACTVSTRVNDGVTAWSLRVLVRRAVRKLAFEAVSLCVEPELLRLPVDEHVKL